MTKFLRFQYLQRQTLRVYVPDVDVCVFVYFFADTRRKMGEMRIAWILGVICVFITMSDCVVLRILKHPHFPAMHRRSSKCTISWANDFLSQNFPMTNQRQSLREKYAKCNVHNNQLGNGFFTA